VQRPGGVAALSAHTLVEFLSARGVPAILQALAVFVLVTAIWLRWLYPYVGQALRKVRERRGA
jgi:hypothetical protein